MLYDSHVKSWVAALGISMATCACSGGYSPAPEAASQALAEDGTDVADLATRIAAMTASFASSGGSTELKLSTIRATTGPFYAPNGCLTGGPKNDSNKLTLDFKQCDGPWGLSDITGDLELEQSDKSKPLAFLAQHLFSIGGAEVTFSAKVQMVFDGADRTMTWKTTNLTGTTARGRSFANSSVSLTLTWQLGGTCITASGTSTGEVSGSPVSTQVNGLVRCDAACPTSGQVVVWPSPSAQPSEGALSLSFTGMDVAYFAAGGGNNPIQLSCGF